MIGCVINKENDQRNLFSFSVSYKVTEMFSEFYVPSFFEAVPDNLFVWPKHRDEEVSPLGVSKCRYFESFSFFSPASFDAWEEFNPFFILKSYEDSFFLSALAIR